MASNLYKNSFGMEVEVYIDPSKRDFDRGDWKRGLLTSSGWYAERDGSLTSVVGFPVEFTSPVLSEKDLLTYISNLHKFINARGAFGDATCGIHVHIGMNSVENVFQRVANLLILSSIFEPVLYSTAGRPNRLKSTYCHPLGLTLTHIREFIKNPLYLLELSKKFKSHYSGCSLNYMFGNDLKKDTVELRYFGALHNGTYPMWYLLTPPQIALSFLKTADTTEPKELLEKLSPFVGKLKMVDGVLGIIEDSKSIIDCDEYSKLPSNLEKNFISVVKKDADLSRFYNLEEPCVVSVP